jgi:transposase InsO family protein
VLALRDGRIPPQPHKRPRSSCRRFAAERPNQTWQSDFTHWRLTDGTDTEIIGCPDDHSRFLLHLSVQGRISGTAVTTTFSTTAAEFGFPASTLTDNGNVYTTHFARTLALNRTIGWCSQPQLLMCRRSRPQRRDCPHRHGDSGWSSLVTGMTATYSIT